MTPTREPKGRSALQIRPLKIETGFTKYAEGSALVSMGNTVVLCNASFEPSVPGWLVGSGKGWVTAEYSMLPRSTHTRTKREREKVGGRTQEIQRLIGRALRAIVDMRSLGERSITLDCDVLQADGGTRTASINGAYVALMLALEKQGLTKVGSDSVAAISVGIKDGSVLVDLDYPEDSGCEVDMNFVVTGNGKFVEVQGTAEQKPFDQQQLNQMTEAAVGAIAQIKEIQRQALNVAR